MNQVKAKVSDWRFVTRSSLAIGVVGLILWAVGLFTSGHHMMGQVGFGLVALYIAISVVALVMRQNAKA